MKGIYSWLGGGNNNKQQQNNGQIMMPQMYDFFWNDEKKMSLY